MPTDHIPANRELIAGMRDQLPLVLGVFPLGLIFGALSLSAGLSPLATQGLSFFVFAGSAQFVAISLFADGTPGLLIVLSIFIVNLRHGLYSASFAPRLRSLSRPWKVALSWLLTDEAFAVASLRYARGRGRMDHWYTLGTGLTLWASWQVSTALGIALGAAIPTNWRLEFALPLTMLALLSPRLIDRPSWTSALCAGTAAVLLADMPFRLNLLIGPLIGIVAGWFLETREMRSSEEVPYA
jgi:4-azaleucine resistance transporter AzlC